LLDVFLADDVRCKEHLVYEEFFRTRLHEEPGARHVRMPWRRHPLLDAPVVEGRLSHTAKRGPEESD